MQIKYRINVKSRFIGPVREKAKLNHFSNEFDVLYSR